MSTINFDPSDDFQNDSSLSSSSPISIKPFHHENDSSCGSEDDPTLALKINKGLSMGYDYELIKTVIEQQNNGDDMSKFIETIVRTAEVNNNSITSSNDNDGSESMNTLYDVHIIDGADLAFSFGNNSFSWQRIEICLKYFHSHGQKKVFIVLPYSLKHHRYERNFSESKVLRDLERKNLLIYTNRLVKQTSRPNSYTHISEMLKFCQKNRGYLISNVSLKDVILDFTIYKQTLEEKIIRYRFQDENFQPLLVSIVNDNEGNDCERYFPLCPYGKKCTYGSKCKYFHIERRHRNPFSISESLREKPRIQHSFNQTRSGPDQFHMYGSSLTDDARMAYEYGLASTPICDDFSFVDQRCSPSQTIPRLNPHFNRSYSMPQEQAFSIQQFEQDVLRYLSILSHPIQQEQSPVNSQEGLANRIQSVRHLWETEDPLHR